MDERSWSRVGGLAGILFVVLLIAGAIAGGASPTAADSSAKIVSFIVRTRDGLLVSAVLTAAACMVVLGFVAGLSLVVREADTHGPLSALIIASGTAAAVVGMLAGLPLAALALVANQPDGLSDATAVRLVFALGSQIIFGALCVLTAAFVAAIGAAALRRVFASAWLGWLCGLVAIVGCVSGALNLTTTDTIAGVFGGLTLVGFGIVVLAASIYMLRWGTAARAMQPRLAVEPSV